MTGDARQSLDDKHAIRRHLAPLRHRAVRDLEFTGNLDRQTPTRFQNGLDIEHAKLDSTTNKAGARGMLVQLRRVKSGAAYSVTMRKVRPIPKKLPARHFIRAWRKHRHLTLEQLAERVGVTHGALSQLERGETNYTQPMLEAIATALLCEPADLIMRDPTDPEGIWSIWDKAEPGQRRQIVEIAKTLLRTGTDDGR